MICGLEHWRAPFIRTIENVTPAVIRGRYRICERGNKSPKAKINITTIFITRSLISLLMLVDWINEYHLQRVMISKLSYDFFWAYIDITMANEH